MIGKRTRNHARRLLGSLGLLMAVGAGLFSACAEGTSLEETTVGTSSTGPGSGGGGGDGPGVGEIGGPCDAQGSCLDDAATCTQVGTEKVCTVPCPPACPSGTYCAIVQGDSLCIPDKGHDCLQCNAAVDCKDPSDECLKAPLGDKFCARDCSTLGTCPNGFTCMEATEYAAPPGGGTGGGGGAAGSGGAGGGDAGSENPPPPVGVPYKFCVPSGGLSCPCNAKRDGVTHACSKETPAGLCKGTEKCNGEAAKWEGCTASDPVPELCNMKDDDCDEQVDEGEGDELCASEGPPPPHSGWVCAAGTCDKGPCDPGWADFPPGPVASGCACAKEAGEPNGTCATATTVGAVSDIPGSTTVISGTLSAVADVDFYKLDTFDTDEVTTNSYHISIDVTAPSPNNEFLIDVIRGDACTDVPNGPGSAIVSYDWCVDGAAASGTEGEAVCGPTAAIQCGDHSSIYYVRVYRKPGATASCAQYSITVTAMGGDPCDFAQKCP